MSKFIKDDDVDIIRDTKVIKDVKCAKIEPAIVFQLIDVITSKNKVLANNDELINTINVVLSSSLGFQYIKLGNDLKVKGLVKNRGNLIISLSKCVLKSNKLYTPIFKLELFDDRLNAPQLNENYIGEN